jgi:hypothetical protein
MLLRIRFARAVMVAAQEHDARRAASHRVTPPLRSRSQLVNRLQNSVTRLFELPAAPRTLNLQEREATPCSSSLTAPP